MWHVGSGRCMYSTKSVQELRSPGAENDPYKSVSTIVILTYDGKFFYMEKPNWYIIVIVVNIIYLLKYGTISLCNKLT